MGVLRDQVVSALTKNLAAHEMDISERAGVKLSILIDRIGSGFANNGSDGPRLLVSARLTDISNNVLWQRDRYDWFRESRRSIEDDPCRELQQQQWAAPLEWIKKEVDPKEIMRTGTIAVLVNPF